MNLVKEKSPWPTYRPILTQRTWLIPLALFLLVVLLRLPSLEHPFDNDSAANAYHARLILRGEPLYSTHHTGHHMPAVYYVHALAMLLLGDSTWAVKFFLMVWTIITVYVMYQLGTLLMGRAAGVLAAIFYAVLTAHLWMWGNSTEIEMFANLPRTATVWVMLILTRSYPLKNNPGPAWKFFLVGLLGVIAFLFKAIYVFSLALAGLMLLLEGWQNRTLPGTLRITIGRGLWIAGGFVAGLLPVIVYFGILGLLPRFLLIFQLGKNYVHADANNLLTTLLYPMTGIAYNNVAILTLSLVGLVIILANKTYRSTPLFYLATWGILSFIEAGAFVRVFRFYYYLLLVPPLALLASWFLFKIYHDIQRQVGQSRPLTAPLVLALLLVVTFSISAAQNFKFYYHYVWYRLGQETRRDFLIKGSPFGPQLVMLQDLADYIKTHTTPTDYIFYWSENVQLYYLTDRQPPTEVIWVDYVQSRGLYQDVFVPETKYFIIDPNRGYFDESSGELEQNYRLETVIYDQKVYRRIEK